MFDMKPSRVIAVRNVLQCVSFKLHGTQATECAIGLSFEFIMKHHVEKCYSREAAAASAAVTVATAAMAAAVTA